jgi:arylsulfatase A-like enzyme
MIIMDTTRADRCSAYGYERDTTPFLRELSDESTRYTNTYSTSCWTVPAHGSILTGNYAIRHGATQENLNLATVHLTLPEVFQSQGYSTIGIAENAMLVGKRGFAQGFDVYHEAFRSAKKGLPGQNALDLFQRELNKRDHGKPFFAFVNLIAPHSPYTPPQEFREKFLPGAAPGLNSNRWRDHYLGKQRFTNEQLEILRRLYDAEIAHTDYIVRKMAEYLQENGTWDDTIFIVTSDHGENIGDHGHMDHVFCLYDTVTKVPLIIRDPRSLRRSTDGRPVQVHDLFLTTIDMAGLTTDAHVVHGLSLANGVIPGDRPMFAEYYQPVQALRAFKEVDRQSPTLDPFRRRIRSIVHGGFKYVWGSDGKHELYHLAEDPGEMSNLTASAEHSKQQEQLDAMLKEWTITASKGAQEITAPQMIDEGIEQDTRDALESLGYL